MHTSITSGNLYQRRAQNGRNPVDPGLGQYGVVLNRIESLDVVGLTVSPDRKTVVTSGISTVAGDDLMLIQNFR